MEKFYRFIMAKPKLVVVIFFVFTVICGLMQLGVGVNYDMTDYLPSDSPSTIAIDVMNAEYTGGIPNARVMVKDLTLPQALEYKEKIAAVKGVSGVTWLDDSCDIRQPIETLDQSLVDDYFKDGAALYSVTVEDRYLELRKTEKKKTAIQALNGQLARLETGLQTASGDAEKTAEIQAQIEQTKNLISLLTGSSGMIQGTQAYLNGLHDGAAQIDNGLSALKESYSKFHSGLQTMTDTLAGMLVQLSSLSDGISELASQYSGLDSGIRQYTDGVAKIVSGYQSITSGTSALTSGSKDLRSGAEDLKDGVSALYDGTEDISDGSQQLADGTGKLREKTNGIDKKIDNEIDSLLDEIKGKDLSNISFVSDKNTNVKSVQFVMKTDAVTMPAEETAAPAQEEHLSFWQKLLRLFGIGKK